jgi:hypothetical protein
MRLRLPITWKNELLGSITDTKLRFNETGHSTLMTS